jgi:hypothetical protein
MKKTPLGWRRLFRNDELRANTAHGRLLDWQARVKSFQRVWDNAPLAKT